MEDKDIELIERYCRHELSGLELASFERRLADDVEFSEAVQLHADALEAIRMEGTAILRARLTAKGKEMDAQTPERYSRKWLWLLPAILLCATGTWVLWQAPWQNSKTLTPPMQFDSPTILPDSLTPATTPKNEVQKQPVNKVPNDQQIFAAWFRPYRDASIEPSVRGDNVPSPSDRFQQLYWKGKYDAALVAFDSLSEYSRNNDNLLFLKANCLLYKGKGAEAATLLEMLTRNGQSRFKDQLSWYLALSQLQGGRRKEAEVLLRQIVADPRAVHHADAQHVLRDLK